MIDDGRIGGLDADALEAADLPGEGSEGILGGVQGDGDDADLPLAVGDAHPADDVFSVLMENAVEPLNGFGIFHDDAHDGDPCFHDCFLPDPFDGSIIRPGKGKCKGERSFHPVDLRRSMCAEDLPLAHAQAAQDGLALSGAELGVAVHGGHQNGGVAVMLRLGRDQVLEVDVDVAGEGDGVVVVDQDDLPGQMAALALVDLEVQVPEVEKAHLGQRFAQLRDMPPGGAEPGGGDAAVARQQLADVQIGPVEGIFLPEAVLPLGLGDEILRRAQGGDDLVEILHEAAVVRVRVGQQQALGNRVKIRDQGPDEGQCLLTVPGIAAVDAEDLAAGADKGRVAAAGRLDEKNVGVFRDLMGADPRLEALAPVPGQKLRKAADAVEGPVGQQALLVQRLHGEIRVDQKGLALGGVQVQQPGDAPDEGGVENAVVIGPGGGVVLDDLHLAKLLGLLQKFRHPALVLHIDAHPELLQGRIVALGVDVGDVEVEFMDQLQHLGGCAGPVLEDKLQQHDAAFLARVLQIPDPLQGGIGQPQLLGGPFHVQEEHMGVHGLVIADPGDVDAQGGKAPAGLQKCADVVGQRCGVGLFHRDSLLLVSWFQFTTFPGQKQ